MLAYELTELCAENLSAIERVIVVQSTISIVLRGFIIAKAYFLNL